MNEERTLPTWERMRASRIEIAPPILYKYRSAEKATEILTEGRVWHASPCTFNDPFDSQWDTLWPIRTPGFIDACRKGLRAIIEGKASIPDDANPKFRKGIDEFVRNLPSDPVLREAEVLQLLDRADATNLDLDGAAAKHIHRFCMRLRVFCVSEHLDCSLTWSHYGDHHKGIALGFDTQVTEETWKVIYERVKYSQTLPRLVDVEEWYASRVLGGPLPRNYGARDWCLFKSAAWSYEREWRAIGIAPESSESQSDFRALRLGSIARVVFGCHFPQDRVKEVTELASKTNPTCQFIQLHRSRDSYALEPEYLNSPFKSPGDVEADSGNQALGTTSQWRCTP